VVGTICEVSDLLTEAGCGPTRLSEAEDMRFCTDTLALLRVTSGLIDKEWTREDHYSLPYYPWQVCRTAG
jgi:hypothetical protein